jgi:hypothetical protein
MLTVTSGHATAPASVRMNPGTGYIRFQLVPTATGVVSVRAEILELDLNAASNAMQVHDVAPSLRIYWGDLHSHSEYSFDAVGDRPFHYARFISGLDFYALTDHSWPPDADGTTTGLSEFTWKAYGAATDDNYVPGSFVTLHAYECSMDGPYGHHNVYFRDVQGPLHYARSHILPEAHTSTLPDIWASLKAGEALTIPHHTGKFPPGIVFTPQNDEFRRNFEIYSGHGLSERFDPDHPLAFEKSDFTSDSESVHFPSYAQDAWKLGLRLSTIAATDDHYSQPGKPHWGATAVLAQELTRDGVFRALHDRRTYATTGSRIILDFTLNGMPMGSVVPVRSPPTIGIGVIGTDAIARVELLRYDLGDGDFITYRQWEPQASSFRHEFVDKNWRAGAMYYVRITQVNRIRGRPVMAWSSPIWTTGQH